MKIRHTLRLCLVMMFLLLCAVPHALAKDAATESKRVFVDGIGVFYQDSGPRDAPTLLFIHGWGCDSSFWQQQVDAFNDRYRCIALDMPGFGRSDKPQNIAYTLNLFAKAVKSVADDAGATDMILIGHSMGFAVARQFLVDYPDRVKAAVNVDGAVMFLPEDPASLTAMTEATEQFAQVFAGPGREAALDEFVEGIFYGKTPENVREMVRKTMTTMDPYVCASSMQEFVKPEWWKPHSFALPCLALYAENPQEDANLEENLRREFSDMTFVLWNDTGHFLMMEKPERFNSILQDFLDTIFNERKMNKYEDAMKKLDEKLGNKDGLISLSTIALEPAADGQSRPDARLVNAYYKDGAFYTVTYATTNKMRQIAKNPNVAVCIIVENFTAEGIGENLGWVRDEKNAEIMATLRTVFAEWYNEANNDEDPNTCLLRVRLTRGLWNDPHQGIRNRIDFINKTAD